MFFELCDEFEDINFIESLYLLLDLLKQSLIACLKPLKQKMNQFFNCFAELFPAISRLHPGYIPAISKNHHNFFASKVE